MNTTPLRPQTPEDFRVDELPLYPAAGEGAHTFVHVEKRLRNTDEVARGADRIASLILYGDTPEVDIRIAIERLRDRAEELFPGRGWFFESVYESRFERLMEQWREEASL